MACKICKGENAHSSKCPMRGGSMGLAIRFIQQWTPPTPEQDAMQTGLLLNAYLRHISYRNDSQRDWYASWDAYDAAQAGMLPLAREAQRKAEIVELERMAGL